MDVKPWDDETDMVALEKSVRSVEKEGLVWGASSLVAIGYGIKKLQINLVIEDDKIGLDDLQEQLTSEFEDYIQSTDIAAMQSKLINPSQSWRETDFFPLYRTITVKHEMACTDSMNVKDLIYACLTLVSVQVSVPLPAFNIKDTCDALIIIYVSKDSTGISILAFVY